ncbi:hypothetical protein DFH07DRAFT_781618 [Mycena maculata]|uniref:Uncharacterized protein n=1 Tax=Mycena maculata TaxID=230809 RepID=A0AAD7HXU7_9AGAR|nr:hypothetical protein DFH07DRAFT_781618 [Mycena maculata]
MSFLLVSFYNDIRVPNSLWLQIFEPSREFRRYLATHKITPIGTENGGGCTITSSLGNLLQRIWENGHSREKLLHYLERAPVTTRIQAADYALQLLIYRSAEGQTMRRSSCWGFAGEWCRMLGAAPSTHCLLNILDEVTGRGFTTLEDEIDVEGIQDLTDWLKKFQPLPTHLVEIYEAVKALFQDNWDSGWARVFISSDGIFPTC